MLHYFFIVGCQRSGTTLMGQILGAHPQAVLIDENDKLYDWTRALMSGNKDKSGEKFSKCCRYAMTKYIRPEERFLEDGALLKNVKYVILKAPNLTYQCTELKHAFPDAKIVYMVRYIRNVVASIMRFSRVPILDNQIRLILGNKYIAETFSEEVSILLNNSIGQHIKAAVMAKIKMSLAECFEDNGHLVKRVHYEDLTALPNEIIPGLLEDIGISLSPDCLTHDTIFTGKAPGHTQRDRPIDQSSKEKWRDVLTDKQEAEIWKATGKFMEKMGYNRYGTRMVISKQVN